ncbi:RE2 [Symbiodinium natans]|uniref:RE2 protein n=1 Tax=Symbiodinium natans TaxID=878477 RepID=A0A812M0E3_9DINO|nr:RE2 [Symbiodinium natans]
MIARVPVYGTTDAGRNLYLRIVEETKSIGLKSSQIMSALYYAHDTSGRLCAMLCTHVDDFFWAAFGEGELKIQQLLDHFKIGRIEEGSFRFCGREYAQHPDGTIEINSRDNTRAIAPLEIPKGAKLTTPVTQGQRTALRSVIGSLAWVARATRPDLAYRVNALQQRVTVATIDTMREANRVVALALADAERCIVYRAKILPWSSGPLAVVTFCDASFAAEAGYKSQRGRLHYLTDADTARDVNAPKHKLHLVAFGSSTMKRVCRATLQCEAYSLQHATEHGDRIRATLLELQGKLPSLHDWSEVAPRKMLHLQYSDCRSLADHLLSSVPRQVEDKRLAIEMTALRQALWVDETPTSEAFAPFGDILRWIPTHLQLADCLTKSMKPKLLNDALESNEAVVREEAPAETCDDWALIQQLDAPRRNAAVWITGHKHFYWQSEPSGSVTAQERRYFPLHMVIGNGGFDEGEIDTAPLPAEKPSEVTLIQASMAQGQARLQCYVDDPLAAVRGTAREATDIALMMMVAFSGGGSPFPQSLKGGLQRVKVHFDVYDTCISADAVCPSLGIGGPYCWDRCQSIPGGVDGGGGARKATPGKHGTGFVLDAPKTSSDARKQKLFESPWRLRVETDDGVTWLREDETSYTYTFQGHMADWWGVRGLFSIPGLFPFTPEWFFVLMESQISNQTSSAEATTEGKRGERQQEKKTNTEGDSHRPWLFSAFWKLAKPIVDRLGSLGLLYCGTLCTSIGLAAKWAYWLLVGIVGVFLLQLAVWTYTWVVYPTVVHSRPATDVAWTANYVQSEVRGPLLIDTSGTSSKPQNAKSIYVLPAGNVEGNSFSWPVLWSETESEADCETACQADQIAMALPGKDLQPLASEPCRDVARGNPEVLLKADEAVSCQEGLLECNGEGKAFHSCDYHRALYRGSQKGRTCSVEGCLHAPSHSRGGVRLCKLHAAKDEKKPRTGAKRAGQPPALDSSLPQPPDSPHPLLPRTQGFNGEKEPEPACPFAPKKTVLLKGILQRIMAQESPVDACRGTFMDCFSRLPNEVEFQEVMGLTKASAEEYLAQVAAGDQPLVVDALQTLVAYPEGDNYSRDEVMAMLRPGTPVSADALGNEVLPPLPPTPSLLEDLRGNSTPSGSRITGPESRTTDDDSSTGDETLLNGGDTLPAPSQELPLAQSLMRKKGPSAASPMHLSQVPTPEWFRAGAYTNPVSGHPDDTTRALQAIAKAVGAKDEASAQERGKLSSIGRTEERALFLARGCDSLSVPLGEATVGKELFHALRNTATQDRPLLRSLKFPINITNRFAFGVCSLCIGGKGSLPDYALCVGDFPATSEEDFDFYSTSFHADAVVPQRPQTGQLLKYGEEQSHMWPMHLVLSVWEELWGRFCEEIRDLERKARREMTFDLDDSLEYFQTDVLPRKGRGGHIQRPGHTGGRFGPGPEGGTPAWQSLDWSIKMQLLRRGGHPQQPKPSHAGDVDKQISAIRKEQADKLAASVAEGKARAKNKPKSKSQPSPKVGSHGDDANKEDTRAGWAKPPPELGNFCATDMEAGLDAVMKGQGPDWTADHGPKPLKHVGLQSHTPETMERNRLMQEVEKSELVPQEATLLGTYLRNRLLHAPHRPPQAQDVQQALDDALAKGCPELVVEVEEYLAKVGDSSARRAQLTPTVWSQGQDRPGSATLTWGDHAWEVFDYGDTLQLSAELKLSLQPSSQPHSDWEPRQCLVLHIAAALLWSRSKQLPSWSEVQTLASRMRGEFYVEADKVSEALGELPPWVTRAERDLRVFVHDFVYFGHDKDYRSLAALPPEELAAVAVHVVRLDAWKRPTVEALTGCTADTRRPLVVWLLVYDGHMRLLVPTSRTVPAPARSIGMHGWEVHLEAAAASGAQLVAPAKCPRCEVSELRRTGVANSVLGLYRSLSRILSVPGSCLGA